MTATLLRAAVPSSAADSTGVTARPPVDDLPDATRDFFAGCVTTFDLPRYVVMVGPLTATPGLTLADVVKAIAG